MYEYDVQTKERFEYKYFMKYAFTASQPSNEGDIGSQYWSTISDDKLQLNLVGNDKILS